MPRYIFLDFDGPVRTPKCVDGEWSRESYFSPELLSRVRDLAIQCEAKIVVTSDLRENGKDWVLNQIGDIITEDILDDRWETPKLPGQVDRWEEVWEWLAGHPSFYGDLSIVILEDTYRHFETAPSFMKDRVVWCNNRHGFVTGLYALAVSRLSFTCSHKIS